MAYIGYEEREAGVEESKVVISFITGLLIGGLLIWVFSTEPEAVSEPVIATEITQTKDSGDKYKECVLIARSLQNPDFWNGELKNPVSLRDSMEFIDSCMRQ